MKPESKYKSAIELIKDAFDRKNHNYASSFYIKRFSTKDIIEAIKSKQEGRLRNPDYKDKYKHLTIYDDEITFLINFAIGELK